MVLICRHGQTEWNRAGKLQGSLDSPLTQVGVVQAVQVGKLLHGMWHKIDTIHSSPKPRALNTSKIITNTLQIPHDTIQVNNLLREMSFGTHEGMQKSDRQQGAYAEQVQHRTDDPYRNALPGGENYTQVRDRAQDFLESVQVNIKDVIVAHEAFNRMLIGLLGKLTDSDALSISQPNNVVYRVQSGNVYHKYVGTDHWIPGIIQK